MLALVVSASASVQSVSASALQARQGELVEGLIAARRAAATESADAAPSDVAAAERYAAYLPSNYSPERSWPVLIVMDPRGRAAAAAEIFRPAAERFGYLVLSSESTRSDLPAEIADPNEPALRALLETAETQYGAQPDRIYLAGFSGTSRFAWMAGEALPDRIAGVIGVGGALPGPWSEWSRVGFSYFGAAGRHDFNHREMRELDELLDGVLPHRFLFFPGVHQWLRPQDAEQALGWMELEAMRRELAPKRAALVETLLRERLEAAEIAEREARLFETFEILLAVLEDFEGLSDAAVLEPVRARASRLATDDRVTRANLEVASAVEVETNYRERVGAVVRRIAYEASPPTAAELARELDLTHLRKLADGDSIAADSARRQLEIAYVHMAIMTPPGLLAQKAPRRAALSLELATMVFPDRPLSWLRLAEARALASAKKAAIEALAKAVELGFTNADYLRTHEGLSALRTEKGFQKLVELAEAAGE